MAYDIGGKAEVSPRVKIGNNCRIYPSVYIEEDVVTGDNCVICPFVSILKETRLGFNNTIHRCSVMGTLPQDFEFEEEGTELIIGSGNIIRENVVINWATHMGGQTVIGHDNFLMEGAHISHDTEMGSQCVFGYGAEVAGDCEIDNGVIFSSSVIEDTNTRVDDYTMIQAGTTFYKDVPPYIIAGDVSVSYGGPNKAILETYGITREVQGHVANAYRLIFHGQTSVFDTVLQVKEQIPNSPEIESIIRFIRATKAGIIDKLQFAPNTFIYRVG